jgi:molybdopterin-guanine dinucleotide biosynthesis protein A
MLSTILAGGENRRFPSLKGLMEFAGKRVIETQVELLRRYFEGVLISTNEPEKYFYLNVPLIGDVYGGTDSPGPSVGIGPSVRGPMLGIFSVLFSTRAEGVFAVACDMPFIKPEALQLMKREAAHAADAVVPLWAGRPEPLFAWYSARSLEKMEKHILSGRTGLRDFLENADVKYVPEELVKRADPEGESFININTPGDYEKARGLFERSAAAGGGKSKTWPDCS